jgi:FHA domain-containing protein
VATCPSGHASTSEDFCDVCGVLIGAAPSLAPGGAPAALSGPFGAAGPGSAPGGTMPAPGQPCPRCGVTRAGQFCESCGYDFTVTGQDTLGPDAYQAPPPPPPLPVPPAAPVPSASAPPPSAAPEPVPAAQVPQSAPASPAAAAEWTAVVTADRAYFDAIQAAGGPDAAAIAYPAYCPQRRFRLAGTEVRIGRHSVSSGIDPEIDLSVPPADPGVSRLHAVLLQAPDGTWSVVDPGSANGTAVNGSEIPRGQAVPLREGDRIHLGAWTQLRVIREA